MLRHPRFRLAKPILKSKTDACLFSLLGLLIRSLLLGMRFWASNDQVIREHLGKYRF